jgi:AraC-like DNA-binding protein
MSAPDSISRFSTQSVPPGMRFDYWMSTLRQSLWPVTEWTELATDFAVELREAPLGCVTSMEETISAHRSHRTRRDVEISGDRCYMLIANQVTSWSVAHHGHIARYAPGDVVLVDSQGELETWIDSPFKGTLLKLPVDWVHTWLPDPAVVAGRRISTESRWGRVFCRMISQLTPDLAAAPPLPHTVLTDQLGAILALIAGDEEARRRRDLLKAIKRRIRERCTEPQLTATDIAVSLNVAPRIVHRVLATANLTFASHLLNTRVQTALQILLKPSSHPQTIPEVARQAGFSSASHLTRVVRRRTGHTPLQLQRRHQ